MHKILGDVDKAKGPVYESSASQMQYRGYSTSSI